MNERKKLKDKCRRLGVQTEDWTWPGHRYGDEYIWATLREHGWRGTYHGGKVISAALVALFNKNISQSAAFTEPNKFHLFHPSDLSQPASRDQYITNFRNLHGAALKTDLVRQDIRGLTVEEAVGLYDNLSTEQFRRLASFAMRRDVGSRWPRVIVARNQEIKFIEPAVLHYMRGDVSCFSALRDAKIGEVKVVDLNSVNSQLEHQRLDKQCEHLGILFDKWHWDGVGTPEQYVLDKLVGNGWIGRHDEGGSFGLALRAATLDPLTEEYADDRPYQFSRLGFDARQLACAYGILVEPRPRRNLQEAMLDAAQTITKNQYLNNLQEIELRTNEVGTQVPSRSLSKTATQVPEQLFDIITDKSYRRQLEWLLAAHSDRSGWPDLTLVRGAKVQFVEVKVSDKLIASQISQIPQLVENGIGDVEVVQLTK